RDRIVLRPVAAVVAADPDFDVEVAAAAALVLQHLEQAVLAGVGDERTHVRGQGAAGAARGRRGARLPPGDVRAPSGDAADHQCEHGSQDDPADHEHRDFRRRRWPGPGHRGTRVQPTAERSTRVVARAVRAGSHVGRAAVQGRALPVLTVRRLGGGGLLAGLAVLLVLAGLAVLTGLAGGLLGRRRPVTGRWLLVERWARRASLTGRPAGMVRLS